MDVTGIPFVEKVGIIRNSDGKLELPFDDSVHNHLQTVHASAQFALAETASGEALRTAFPDFTEKVLPVMRDSQIKYKKPATSTLVAHSSVSDESARLFREQFQAKGRAFITVNVEIRDTDGTVTSSGSFRWFIQRLP